MLYSTEMNLRENQFLSYKYYINKPQLGKYYCISRSLEYLGIQISNRKIN